MSDGNDIGYLSSIYAESLREFGEPVELVRSGGWLLRRPIEGSSLHDAMGPYPLFGCRDWACLEQDIAELQNKLVSVVLVSDPFAEMDGLDLRRTFPDLLLPFKDHFVVDLKKDPDSHINSHNRRYARKAAASLTVTHTTDLRSHLGTWNALYANLIARHGIEGIATFSSRSFLELASVPGLEVFYATHDGEVVGMTLWMREGDKAYYHLAAYSAEGYRVRASYALFAHALSHFRDAGVKWLDLGAGSGLVQGEDGLTRFKRGWSTGTKPVMLCGRILDAQAYAYLAQRRGVGAETAFFPAYRHPGRPRSAASGTEPAALLKG